MKPFFLAAALFLAAFTTKTFASDVTVAPSTLVSFQVKFNNASNVQWTSVDHLYRADFTIDGEKTIAFFNKSDGALVVTCNYITVADLSRDLQRSLKKQTASAMLTELYVVKSDDSVDHYATIRQADQTIVLKAVADRWVVHQKK